MLSKPYPAALPYSSRLIDEEWEILERLAGSSAGAGETKAQWLTWLIVDAPAMKHGEHPEPLTAALEKVEQQQIHSLNRLSKL